MTKQEPPRNEKVYRRSTQHPKTHPIPPSANPTEVWKKVQTLVDSEEKDPAKAPEPEEPKLRKRGAARRRQRRLRWRRLLDTVGLVVWIGIVIKLFIGDLDRDILMAFAPDAVWLLDLRWFAVIGLAALFLILFKLRTIGASIAYVIAFPLVVLFWKVPKALFNRRSPILVVGLAGFVTSIASRAKLIVVALAAGCLSGILIGTGGTPWLISIGAIGMLTTLIWTVVVTAIDLLQTTSFLRAQERFIKWLIELKIIDKLTAPIYPDQLTLKRWSVDDAKKFRDAVGYGLLARSALHFWAYSIDRYRKGPSVVVLNAIVVISLFVQVVVAFTFINWAVFVIDPTQFSYTGHPNLWAFAYYSATAVYFGEIGIVSPVGDIAIVAKLLNDVIGGVGVLTVVISILMGYRATRLESSSVDSIQILTDKAHDIEKSAIESAWMSLEELEEHLLSASWELFGFMNWILAKTPKNWAVDATNAQGEGGYSYYGR